MAEFKRIFLITIDCLRADHVGSIGGKNLTPNIDKFAKESIVFTRAFANGPGTNQSFPAILTSTYFFIHGGLRLNPKCITLAEVLREHGYRTVAFHSNPFLSRILGWSKGFDEFYDFLETLKGPSAYITRQQEGRLSSRVARFTANLLGASKRPRVRRLLKKIYYMFSNFELPYLEGSQLNKYVIKWIKENLDRKFFLWMHYMDPHNPFVPPEKYLKKFSDRRGALKFNLSINTENPSNEELEILKKLYEGEVKYTDECIGDFLSFLEDNRLLEDSLLIITADHGYAFMEHGKLGHHPEILYNEVLHVPLILYGLDSDIKIGYNVQLLDIPPTILKILNIKNPPTFMGESLLDQIENSERPIFSESAKPDLINLRYHLDKKLISCIKGVYKLIINEVKETRELYDIKKDFNETNNLYETEKDILKRLYSLIEDHISDEDIFKLKMGLISKK